MWWDPTTTKKIMTENGLFVLGRPETQLHDGKKNHGRSEGEENIEEFPVTVGGRGRAMRFLSYMYVRVCEALGSN